MVTSLTSEHGLESCERPCFSVRNLPRLLSWQLQNKKSRKILV